jgi:class 3 adenylate cyclase
MSNRVQVRWIEHAESRSVLEHAALQRSASEPHISIGHARTGSVWFHWLRELGRPLGRTIATAPSPLADTTIAVQARSLAMLEIAYADVDDDRIPVAILITDIVGSTRLVAEMGDRDWRVLLDRHDDAIRNQIERFGGREVGNRGDGFVVIFDTPARAVCCATAIAGSIALLGIRLRCGIHFGEVHFKRGKISGIAAHIAARIAATARPGEAAVSKTVRDRVIGSGFVFEDRGIHQLRDIPEQIQLYAVRAISAPIIPDIIETVAGDLDEQPWRTHNEPGSDLRRTVKEPNRRVRGPLRSGLAVSGHEQI